MAIEGEIAPLKRRPHIFPFPQPFTPLKTLAKRIIYISDRFYFVFDDFYRVFLRFSEEKKEGFTVS